MNHLNRHRNRLISGNGAKNFVYSEKNAVDSVKKLDKIISNHNRNLQEIIKHKNQLIKTITAKQACGQASGRQSNAEHLLFGGANQFTGGSGSHANSSNPNSQQQASPFNSSLFLSSKPNKHAKINCQSIDFVNKSARPGGYHSAGQLNSSLNSQLNSSNSLNGSNFASNANIHANSHPNLSHLNQNKSSVNKRLWRQQTADSLNNVHSFGHPHGSLSSLGDLNSLIHNNNSLTVLTRAINEEAELNKQKLINLKKSNSAETENSDSSQATTPNDPAIHKMITNKPSGLSLSDLIDDPMISESLIVSTNNIMINTLDLISCTINSSFSAGQSAERPISATIPNALNGTAALKAASPSQPADKESAPNQTNQINAKRKIMSKMDEREDRLKKFKNDDSFQSEVFYVDNGDEWQSDFENDDEIAEVLSDCEERDEYAYRLKSSSIIFNAGKLSPKLTRPKLSYLDLIGLTTNQNKERLEFNKFVRTKRTLKEISNVNCGSASSIGNNRNSNLRTQSLRSQSLRSNPLRNTTLRSDSLRNQPGKPPSLRGTVSSSSANQSTSNLPPQLKQLVKQNRSKKAKTAAPEVIESFLQTIPERQVNNGQLEPAKGNADTKFTAITLHF